MCPLILSLLLVLANLANCQDWNIIVAKTKSLAFKEFVSNQKLGRRLISLAVLPPSIGAHQPGFAAIFAKTYGPDWASNFKDGLLEDVQEKVQEYAYRDFLVTKACAFMLGNRMNFWTYYEQNPEVAEHLVFLVTLNDLNSGHFDRMKEQNFRLSHFCAFEKENEPNFAVVWKKSNDSTPYNVVYNEPLEKCLKMHQKQFSNGYTAGVFQVYEVDNLPYCIAVWEKGSIRGQTVIIDSDIARMVEKMDESRLEPMQISSFVQNDTRKYVMLWGKYQLRAPSQNAWETDEIPMSLSPKLQDSFPKEDLEKIQEIVHIFMENFNIPAVSMAVSKEDQLKFAAAFGYKNLYEKSKTDPDDMFRLGTTSKTLTSAAIFKLNDMGKLELDDKVFSPDGILGRKMYKKTYFKEIHQVTVKQLLEETAVWSFPPEMLENPEMFSAGRDKLISWIIDSYPLRYVPGSRLENSYFPYLILGSIIEVVSGLSYKDFVAEHILRPAGVKSFGIETGYFDINTTGVIYYGEGFEDPYGFAPGEQLLPAAGWIMSPTDMLRFLVRIDGDPSRTDLLNQQSIRRMASPSAASNGTYSPGWFINPGRLRGWLSVGKLRASTCLLLRADNGMELAVALNSNREMSSQDFQVDLLRLAEQLVSTVKHWPEHDLF